LAPLVGVSIMWHN